MVLVFCYEQKFVCDTLKPPNLYHRVLTIFLPKMSQKPADFLQSVIGKSVLVKLNSGIEYRGFINLRGIMSSLDGYMNIAMQSTVEYAQGKQTNEYGDCFIRGNNGILILPSLVHLFRMIFKLD